MHIEFHSSVIAIYSSLMRKNHPELKYQPLNLRQAKSLWSCTHHTTIQPQEEGDGEISRFWLSQTTSLLTNIALKHGTNLVLEIRTDFIK